METTRILWVLLLACLAAGLGDPLVHIAVDHLRRTEIGDGDAKYSKIGRFIGIAERALYVFAWYFGELEFVAVWLAFKVAIEWKGGWNSFVPNGGDQEKPRARL